MFCGRIECPNCKSGGDCSINSCTHPEIKNSKTLYFPVFIAGKYFNSWNDLCDYIRDSRL